MQMPKEQVVWLQEHAELRGDRWTCKKTGEDILSAEVGRSIWYKPFAGGTGEVRSILHVACLACNPNATPPSPGSPIYSDELVVTDIEPQVRM